MPAVDDSCSTLLCFVTIAYTYLTVSKSKPESFKAFQSGSSKSFISLVLEQSSVLFMRSHLHFVQIIKVP